MPLAYNVFSVSLNAYQCALAFLSFLISVHVIFDDAFELNDDVDKFVPNSFVKQLMECMEDAARWCISMNCEKKNVRVTVNQRRYNISQSFFFNCHRFCNNHIYILVKSLSVII